MFGEVVEGCSQHPAGNSQWLFWYSPFRSERVFRFSKSGPIGCSKIAIGSILRLSLASMRLLLMHLVLSQHLQNLSLLSYHFGQCLGRWWRVVLSTLLGTLSGSSGIHHSDLRGSFALAKVGR